jgi:hypothetical protein
MHNDCSHRRLSIPPTLLAGLLIILLCEFLLFTDVFLNHRGAFHNEDAIVVYNTANPPTSPLTFAARFVAFNITAIAWVGYLLLLDGLLQSGIGCRVSRIGRSTDPIPETRYPKPDSALSTWHSPIRRRPHHFALLCLASIFIWCIFDTVNFYSIRAWRYIGMPPDFSDRAVGYFFAFGTIVPGMLLSGQVLLKLGLFNWARQNPRARNPEPGTRNPILILSLIVGLAMFLWPILHPDPITNLTLWASLVFLLDPINYWLGRPSMWRDWFNGNFARTLAAFFGGLICGLLWEFWNYWALTKWTYNLPFLGPLEHYRYFEMPVLGLLGFLPFGLESWVLWQTMRIFLDGLAEPLPDDMTLL